jgi:hypothetical protein
MIHADLHRARLAAQQVGAAGHLGGRAEVKVLERIAGGMCRRDIERLEVMELVFDLGPVGDRETEPAHDLLQLLNCLRNRVEPAQAARGAGQRGIERGVDRRGLLAFDALAGGRHRSFECLLQLVEAFASGGLIGRRNRAELLLDRFQAAALGPQKLDAGSFERGRIGRVGQRALTCGEQLIELGKKDRQRHECGPLARSHASSTQPTTAEPVRPLHQMPSDR